MNSPIIPNTHHERRNQTGPEKKGDPRWKDGTGTHRASQSGEVDHWKPGEERGEKEKHKKDAEIKINQRL